MREAVTSPIVEFFHRLGMAKAAFVLAFVMLYRLSDSLIVNMTTPFLLQTGFSLTDVGTIQGGVGLAATIAGVLAGGAIIGVIGVEKSLWVFGILQGGSNLAYFALTQAGRNYPLMVGAMIVEHICTGLATAALVGFLISLCNPDFSATQYALLSSLMAVGRDVITAPAGVLAKSTGWPLFFVLTCLAALPGLFLLPAFAPWGKTHIQ